MTTARSSSYPSAAQAELQGTDEGRVATTSSYTLTQRISELRFSATLGEKPEVELGLVYSRSSAASSHLVT
jgi:hypothetical protein